MTNVRDFGARGDGKTDDTAALTHAIQRGDGHLIFPRGDYLTSRTLYAPLQLQGRLSFRGEGGGARLVMAGAGPALHLVGTHQKSALPESFAEGVWHKERMPTVQDLEIVGTHADADGIRIEGVMQPTLTGLLIRRCRHGIHLLTRDRNVLIADCHIYNNSGVGILFDRVNLHQTNIHGNHISYCKQGGIKIVASEIRNIQVCSNDIEYNYDLNADTSADVLYDCREGTVREGTIVGNTIQAVKSPGGANVRLLGASKDNPNAVGMLTITGNLIGSQETALHLVRCRGVVVSGNCIYSGYHNAIVAEESENLVIGANSIDHNPDYRGKSTDRVLLRGCRNVSMTGLIVQHTREPEIEVRASVEIEQCGDVSLTGCQVLGARGRGIEVRGCTRLRISDCNVRGREGNGGYVAPIAVDDGSRQVLLTNNTLAPGSAGGVQLPAGAGQESGSISW